VYFAPAFGKGQPVTRGVKGVGAIAVFGQAIHYLTWGRGQCLAAARLGSRKEMGCRCRADGAEIRLLVPYQIGLCKSDKPLLDYSVQTFGVFLE